MDPPYKLPIYQIKQIPSFSEQINYSTFFSSVVFRFSLSIVDQTLLKWELKTRMLI